MKSASALCLFLIAAAPMSAVLADDEETQTLHNNVYQLGAYTSCTYAGACAIAYPKTAHKTTLIKAVSCTFALPSGIPIEFVGLSSYNAQNASFALQPFATGFINGTVYYGVNSSVNYYVSQGDQPVVSVSSYGAPVENLHCTISGYHS